MCLSTEREWIVVHMNRINFLGNIIYYFLQYYLHLIIVLSIGYGVVTDMTISMKRVSEF